MLMLSDSISYTAPMLSDSIQNTAPTLRYEDRAQADTGTKMLHIGKNTRSRIISKGISAGNSRNCYRGLVQVPTPAPPHMCLELAKCSWCGCASPLTAH